MRDITAALLLGTAFLGGCDASEPAPTTPPAVAPAPAARIAIVKMEPSKDYPHKTCPVSGEELGSMGPPVAYRVGETEVQLCCASCVAKLEKDPEKYLAILRK